ncbi:cGMP-specific 3',5'-cyclic phosphodiesterase-like, partial [Nannospalax galili]|uniref:cGMP-specific 3',5'-cyclic phosphodiesterase-like n=1 Tax=Nannospalax galili TaxID=1026970 RepID=UPI000819F612
MNVTDERYLKDHIVSSSVISIEVLISNYITLVVNQVQEYGVVGVAQAINKKSENGGTFTGKDEKDFAAYLAFCDIVLHKAQLYETSLLENKRNQVLLDLASLIFEEQQSLEVILKKIATTIISFMQVQRCTIFIVDEDCS